MRRYCTYCMIKNKRFLVLELTLASRSASWAFLTLAIAMSKSKRLFTNILRSSYEKHNTPFLIIHVYKQFLNNRLGLYKRTQIRKAVVERGACGGV